MENIGKCIYKILDMECKERNICKGITKKFCPLSKISNIKPK